MSDKIIATLAASPPRRWTGTVIMAMLGGLLIYLALSVSVSVSQIVLIVFGGCVLFGAMLLHNSTQQVIELTQEHLRVQRGIVLADVSNIAKVERGAFAFKPSNGFLVSLKEPGPRRWSLGLYWCFGRRIGVGGVTGAPQSKAMAEAIAMLIAEQGLSGVQK